MSELTNGQFNSCLKQFPSCNALLPPPLLTAYLNKHIRGAAVLLPLAAASLESFSAVLHFEDEPTPLPLERAAAGGLPVVTRRIQRTRAVAARRAMASNLIAMAST